MGMASEEKKAKDTAKRQLAKKARQAISAELLRDAQVTALVARIPKKEVDEIVTKVFNRKRKI